MIFLPGIKVSLLAVSSLDGIIARKAIDPIDWASNEDKAFLREFLDQCDLCIMGRKSYELAEATLGKRNCLIFTRTLPPATRVSKRKELGPILSYMNPELVDMPAWITANFNFPKKSVAILGGPQIYRYFLSRGWVDEIYLTVEPLIFGTGLHLISSSAQNLGIELRLISANQLNSRGTLLLHYCVKNDRN
tara:strand:- start:6670 stop:7242 length:573 start_codon:yes stop_codon:yes gene_type:complete